jgi:hypothetical protein
MTAQASPDLEQLSHSVARLSEALAASERRHVAIARTMRWGALAFVVTLGAGLYAASDWMKAYAAQLVPLGYLGQMEQQMAGSPPQLNGVLQSLGQTSELNAAMVKILQSASMIAMLETGQPGSAEHESFVDCIRERGDDADKLCYADTVVQDLGEFYLNADGAPLTPPGPNASPEEQAKYQADVMAATMMAGGQVVVDMAALIHRLRRNSDALRGVISEQPVSKTLAAIQGELRSLNQTLTAVQAMAVQMDIMNRHMATMSYSMGSTMGRMGDFMPF